MSKPENGNMEKHSWKSQVEGYPVEHLDDAEIRVVRVFGVVWKKYPIGIAHVFGGKLHDKVSEIEFLLHRVSYKLLREINGDLRV